MRMRDIRGAAAPLAAAAALLLAGCGTTYMRNRARDAKDMVDFGFTTSKKPCFAFYLPGDYFNLTPLGYSNIEGTFHGVGGRQVGSMPFRDSSWGVLLWGSTKCQVGDFNPNDPRYVSPAKLAELKAAGQPLPTEPPRYNVGVVRMLAQDHVGPTSSFYT